MSNSTACVVTGNCTILDGPKTNGTFFVSGSNGYNPDAPVPYWHQRMELATICIADSLTLILIIVRIWYRWNKLKRLRSDDKWMIAAGLAVIAYLISQIETNRYGSGLHIQNVKKYWLEWHWKWEIGWASYYVANSCVKMSVCFCFIEILPIHFKKLRYFVYGLSGFIALLGVTMTFAWMFQCSPFLSNFRWSVQPSSCVNWDIFRWLWIGLSLPIDFLLMLIPLRILKRSNIQGRERRILKWVFCATLLGTITCACGIYGAYENRTIEVFDAFYQETPFVMINNIELFMYTLGASLPVLSRYLVAKAGPDTRVSHSNFSSWARNVPNFFSTAGGQSHLRTVTTTLHQHDEPTHLPTIKSIHSTSEGSNTPDMQHPELEDDEGPERYATRDIEKGQTPSLETQDCMSPCSEDGLIVRDYRARSEDNNNG